MARIEMHLLDGRVIDLSDLTAEEAVAKVRSLGITTEEILETRHYLPEGAIPCIICPKCGARSYNKHDIAEKYCGACHQFHEFL